MNILFIGHEQELNGASRSLINIISELEMSNNIFVLTSYANGAFFDELKKHDVNVLVAPYFRWCVYRGSLLGWIKGVIKYHCYQRFINMFTARKISKIALEKKIDIIHSNSSVINIGALIRKYSGIKHIWHIREFADLDFNMFPLINDNKYYQFMNKYTDVFICISHAISNHYDKIDPYKKRMIYNGVDKGNVIDIADKEKHDGVNFLISGRISEAKGQREAIQASFKLLDENINDFKLYIAGPGTIDLEIPDKYKEHIVFLGKVDNMSELRKSMDVELVCSKSEAFGRVTIEAMMSSMPVTGSNTGGTPELIKNNENGFLYEYGDINQLYSFMKLFISDKTLIKIMGKKAQLYAKNNFLIDRCVDEIRSVYSLS